MSTFATPDEELKFRADHAVAQIRRLRAVRDDTSLPAYLRAIAQQHLDAIAMLARERSSQL